MDPYDLLYPSFTPHTIPITPTISIHALTSPNPTSSNTPPSKPPLLLLHGFPQNLLIWHLITPSLLSTYTLILLDLRGYGKSSKPPGGPNHTAYSKTVMARDCAVVMSALGYERFWVCAHDRGARVAHKLCVEYPGRVGRAMVLDIAPTLAMYEKTDMEFARAYWHWFFLIQPAPLPERLMVRDARGFVEDRMGRVGLERFRGECVESYVAQVGDEETVHAMCEDYRASAGVDLEEARDDVGAGRKIECPLRVLWGRKGVIEMQFDALGEWQKVSREGAVSGESLDCGHYVPEEAPEELVRQIRDFFVSDS
ncbi:putative hydrolase [Usnea florida]